MLSKLFVIASSLLNTPLRAIFKLSNRDIFNKYDIQKYIIIPEKMQECQSYDPFLRIPEYYFKDFHAYTGGNLNRDAAQEAVAATYAVMDHHYTDMGGKECSDYIRESFGDMCLRHLRYNPLNVIDLGCGAGVSTYHLQNLYPGAKILGIDLSPFFLDVTRSFKFFDKTTFVHGSAENLGVPNCSQDVISASYLFHELPMESSIEIIKEAYRALKVGGMLTILDMNPYMKASNPMMKCIFHQTEPYLDEYRNLIQRMTGIVGEIGFEFVGNVSYSKTFMIILIKN